MQFPVGASLVGYWSNTWKEAFTTTAIQIHKIKVIDAKKKTDYKTFFSFLLSSSQSFFLPLAEILTQRKIVLLFVT